MIVEYIDAGIINKVMVGKIINNNISAFGAGGVLSGASQTNSREEALPDAGVKKVFMLSIAMATYNGEKYIREQINSILQQTYQDFELIICDDCSTDSTWIILQEYEKLDVRIHCYKNEQNIGFIKNFEKAISYCNGKYIALSDQDDIWTEDHLEILLNHKANFSLICSNAEYITSAGIRTGITTKDIGKLKYVDTNSDRQLFHLFFCNFVQGATVLFDKSLVNDALPIPEKIDFHDYWLALVAIINNGIKYINNITLLYRQHENNLTKDAERSIIYRIRNHRNNNIDRYCLVYNFISSYKSKLTSDQINICTSIQLYFEWKKNRVFFFKRFFFFIKYYNIIYWDNSLFLFFVRLFLSL
jgi:glycosyltransferase involved in cell wall biosynthesis